MVNRNGLAIVLLSVAAAIGLVPRAVAQSRWENHVDASLIREIVYTGEDLVMATTGGILVYDIAARRFEQFDNTTGLPSNSLNCLVFDGNGNLYVGTDDIGIAKVRLVSTGLSVLRTFNSGIDGLAGNSVQTITVWDDKVVYGTDTGAGIIANDTPGTVFLERNGLPSEVVHDVFPDGDYVWVATDGGVVLLDKFDFLLPVPGAPVSAAVVEKSTDAVWIGSGNGVWRMALSDSSWSQTTGVPVFSLHFDGTTVWAGSRETILRYDGSSWQTDASAGSFRGKYVLGAARSEVRGLVRAANGTLYFGMGDPVQRRGANLLYDESGVVSNQRPNTPGSNRISRLSRDADGSVWATFNNFGVGKLMPSGKWVNYNPSIAESDSLSNLFANLTMLADSDGIKWFSSLTLPPASPRPLDELDDKLDDDYTNDVWTRHPLGSGGGDGYGTARPQRAVEDPVGNRWFLSDDNEDSPAEWQGINILSKDKTEWLQVRPGTVPQMASGNVTDVAFGSGVVYVAMLAYGVQSWNLGGGYDWASVSNLADDVWGVELDAEFGVDLVTGAEVSSLALRSDGVLWIGTDSGVIKYTPPSGFKLIGEDIGFGVGLLSPNVFDMVLDRKENLWLATGLGLNRIDRDDDNIIDAWSTATQYQKVLSKRQYPFSVISQLADADCRALSLHPTRDLLFIGTWNGGLSIFDFTPEPEVETVLSKVYVYPNPIDGSRGHNELRIDNITTPVSIDIYNVEGQLVHSQIATAPRTRIWDLTTNDGFVAASGVYLVRISHGHGSVVRPVSLIR